MRLRVISSNSTYYWSVTNAAPAKPYLQISNQYLPLTTATRAGIKLKVQSGNTTYRAAVYESGYYNTTSAAVGKLSSTTALTRASTSGTTYLTRASTSGTNYGTRASTSGTTYLTRASTSGYATRVSTSGYGTGTQATKSTVTKYDSTSGNILLSFTKVPYVDYIGVINNKSFTKRTYMQSSALAFNTLLWIRMYTDADEHDSVNFDIDWPYSLWTRDLAVHAMPGRIAKTYEMYTYTNGNTTYISTGQSTLITGAAFADGYEYGWYQIRTNRCNNGSKNTLPFRTETINFGCTTSGGVYSRSATYYNYAVNTTSFGGRATGQAYYATSCTSTIDYLYNKNTKVATTVNVSAYIRDIDIWSFSGIFQSRSSSWNRTITITTATLTRASTSATLTRASTSATLTRASTSATLTRASTSGTSYGTRASTSGTTYLTRASTSGTNYGTRASTSGYSGKLSSSKWG